MERFIHFFCFFIFLSCNGWAQNDSDTNAIKSVQSTYNYADTNVTILLVKTNYRTEEVVSVVLTGTIFSTGECGSPPMWGLEKKTDSKWKTYREMYGGDACGYPWVEGTNSKQQLFTVDDNPDCKPWEEHKPIYLSPGEYRLLFMNKTGSIVLTGSFTIEQ